MKTFNEFLKESGDTSKKAEIAKAIKEWNKLPKISDVESLVKEWEKSGIHLRDIKDRFFYSIDEMRSTNMKAATFSDAVKTITDLDEQILHRIFPELQKRGFPRAHTKAFEESFQEFEKWLRTK